MTGPSQTAMILRDLQRGKRISLRTALYDYKCMSLSQRIGELRRRGYTIHTEMIRVSERTRVAQYRLLASPR